MDYYIYAQAEIGEHSVKHLSLIHGVEVTERIHMTL